MGDNTLLNSAVIVKRQDMWLIHAMKNMIFHLSSNLKIRDQTLIISRYYHWRRIFGNKLVWKSYVANTIEGGFLRGSVTSLSRKHYSKSLLTLFAKVTLPNQGITFSYADLNDIVPHENDSIVLSIILVGCNAYWVLINQGNSIDVVFWNIFVGLQITRDQLTPFNEVLMEFSSDHVKIQSYVELRTTIIVRYIVVNSLVIELIVGTILLESIWLVTFQIFWKYFQW